MAGLTGGEEGGDKGGGVLGEGPKKKKGGRERVEGGRH